jgi:hypothetical protein
MAVVNTREMVQLLLVLAVSASRKHRAEVLSGVWTLPGVAIDGYVTRLLRLLNVMNGTLSR